MHRFHDWYMAVSSKGTVTFAVNVKDDYYCYDDHKIWLAFENIFEVYRKDAVDITLMSVWTFLWILTVLSAEKEVLTIMDSLRKPTTDYPEIIEMFR
ncbi:hypothetical protein U9M48_042012, partial [Paspalum notatum var. saurae]